MKNLKQLSAIVMCSLFATMQVSMASVDTGLGVGNGGAVINNVTGGYAGMDTGINSATLKFDGNSHVNWNTLNVNGNETLNFNAVNGANGLTVLNTVNQGMSKIYGQINANNGISNLIISNPNGVLFDGAKFTTAGDVMVTTKNMTNVDVNNITSGTWGTLVDSATGDLINVQIIKDSNFNIGGEFNIIAPKIVGANSTINTGKGLKLVTANGADYALQGLGLTEKKGVTMLRAMNIDGNVEIVNDVGAFDIYEGTKINGDLTAEVGGYGVIEGTKGSGDTVKRVSITGDADLTGHGQQLIVRDADIGGNIAMQNDGGAVELRNSTVGNDANLTTTGWQPIDHQKYNHYVHVSGNTEVGGDLTIESSQNIHLGNYQVTDTPSATHPYWGGQLLDGELTVGGDLKATVTDGGHIMTTIDTTADNIEFTAKSHKEGTKVYGGNILSDDDSTLTANTYKFKSDGYIGGLKASDGYTVDEKVINVMEEYQFIPDDLLNSHEYMNIDGGTITKLETPKLSSENKDVNTYIKSNNDLIVNGANAGVINLVAPDKKITVTGDVHAKEINVGGRTGTLQLDFPNRDFTTHYTNIRDGVVKTINGNDEITYALTNAPGAYNSPDFKQTDGTNTTYLIGPGAPGPNPNPNPNPPNNENAKNLMTQWVPDDPTTAPVNTPVAYAADLDDDEYAPCRKNVDGSVTVVRAYPMAN